MIQGPHPSPRARSHARRAALQAIYQWQLTAQDPQTIEQQFLTEESMRKTDIAYFHDLLYHVVRESRTLDTALLPWLDRPTAQVDPVARAILRIAVYELRYRFDVPWRVAINEAVKLAKIFGAEQSHRYVNGILDKVARVVRRPDKDDRTNTDPSACAPLAPTEERG